MATISCGTTQEKYRFVKEYRGTLSIKQLCCYLKVSRSGFYAWRKRGPSCRDLSDKKLLHHIRKIYQQSRGIYGSPRIHEMLKKQGVSVGRKRVARLMNNSGLKARFARVYRRSTHTFEANYIEDNKRLEAGKPKTINQHWASDLTYIRVGKQWIYLVVILDLYSRRIVSWSLGQKKGSALVMSALQLAIRKRKPPSGLLFHTDRGNEFVSFTLREKMKAIGIERSMSRPYKSIDNAEIESFFQKLKGEYLQGKEYQSANQLRRDIASYINLFYNKTRLHSSLGYVSPMEFEACLA